LDKFKIGVKCKHLQDIGEHFGKAQTVGGLYIRKSPYQPMSFGGKIMKSGREKGGQCKRKRKKRGNITAK
jgi:hypothetical protein